MYVSFIKKYNAGIQKQNGSCIFQTSVEVTFLWVFFFFFWKQILTCLHLAWAMMAKGSKGKITSFDPSWVQLSVYTVSVHQTLFCSFLEPSKIKSKKACHIYIFFPLGDVPTVVQTPGFQISYRIISVKCSVWNGQSTRSSAHLQTSLSLQGGPGEPSGTPGIHRTQW